MEKSGPITIACLIHSLNGGGAERVMASLASRLANRGHTVHLVTLDDASQDRHEVSSTVVRHPLDVMAGGGSLLRRLGNRSRRLNAIDRAIVGIAPDVVLSFCDRTNIDVITALRQSEIPMVVSERSDPQRQDLGWFWNWQRKRTYRDARVIALTDSAASFLQAFVRQPVTVIPSAVDVPPILSHRLAAVANKQVIAIGRLAHEKGFDRLIEAFASVRKNHGDWSLTILGDGNLRGQLETQVHTLGLADAVTMPGWVKPVWPKLAESTIFALPSRYEGFPSALLEAMAVGVPSIAVDVESGPRAIVQNETNGLLVPDNVNGIQAGIERLINDEALREKLGKTGKDVINKFSWEQMVDAYQRVLVGEASRS